ncbi:MAG: hypothetical protein U9M89_00965, partial [Patescibacteria group bacterium]|nr:hypothetical protein [Patescibacteria group bacterium]
LTLTTPRIQELSIAIRKYTQSFCNMKAGVKLTGGGQGGDLLIMTSCNDLRDKLPNLIEKLKQLDLNKSVTVDYISWQDGFEPKGVYLEQNFSQQLYSSWITTITYKLSRLDKKGKIHNKLISEKEYNQLKNNAPILLDKSEKRIYICGKKLTSKELKSTSATLEILEFLLSRVDKNIKNDELPKSIYANNRNAFQSKIITPFEKIYRNRNKNKPLLSISGGITDFFVNLRLNQEICIVQKIDSMT